MREFQVVLGAVFLWSVHSFIINFPFSALKSACASRQLISLSNSKSSKQDVFSRSEFETCVNLGMLGWASGQPWVNGVLTVTFSSWLPRGSSELVTLRLSLPLGVDLEQNEDGWIRIQNISGYGSADGTNLRIGDVIRAVTAREKKMAYPMGNVMFGGIGKPQLVTSFKPCEVYTPLQDVIDAILSHAITSSDGSHPDVTMTEPGDVTLIVERPRLS
eukprot:gene5722-11555_t